LISLNWPNTIIALAVMTLITASLSLLSWPLVIKNAQRIPHPAHLEAAEAAN